MTESGPILLTGLLQVLDRSVDLTSTLLGTPYYMSPELVRNEPYGFKSDMSPPLEAPDMSCAFRINN